MKSRTIWLFCLVLPMLGCTPPKEKQHYTLKDTTWHTYRDGEYLRYQFIGTSSASDAGSYSGNWSTTWQTVDMPSNRPANVPSPLTRIAQTVVPYNEPQQSTLYFVQQEADKTTLYALQGQNGSKIYYVTNGATTTPGALLYNSYVAIGSLAVKTDFSLTACDTSGCATGSGSGTNSMNATHVETVDTPFGTFDSFRVDVAQNFSLLGESLMPWISGTVWIYPPLGVVKASGLKFSDAASGKIYSYDIISLVATNIPVSP